MGSGIEFMKRFRDLAGRVLAHHWKKILAAYSLVAVFVLWQVVGFALDVTSFAVSRASGLNMCSDVSLKTFMGIVRRQSVAVEIFEEFSLEVPMMMLLYSYVLALAAGGRILSSRLLESMAVNVSIGFAVSWAVRALISLPTAFPVDELACKALFQADMGEAMEMLFARRGTLSACAVLHFVVMLYTAVQVLVIPFLFMSRARHRWRDRNAG